MNQKVNIVELTAAFNRCRMNNAGKIFSNEEITKILKSLGFGGNIVAMLITKHMYSQRDGKKKFYSFTHNPIHKSAIEALYEENRKYQREYYRQSNENENSIKEVTTPLEEAITLLKKQGYELRKPRKFDVTKFAEDHPELYKQYLIYEEV